MNQTTSIIFLVILAAALAGHYISQKLLLAKGWKAEDPKPQIKRLLMNGAILLVVSVVALTAADYPFGLFGILVFIEGAVCLAFARKLSKKPEL